MTPYGTRRSLASILINQDKQHFDLFSKPVSMTEFPAIYGSVTEDDSRHNHSNVAERLGFLGRLIHGHNPQAWVKELKTRLGETLDYAEASD